MGVFIMNTYIAVKNRLVFLCGEKKITINKLATESGIAPSTIKNILYGKIKITFLMFFCEYILLFKSFLDIKKQIYYVASWWIKG